jgi:hypothetical protein
MNWTLVNLEEHAQHIPRFNHASLVIESQLIICGGYGQGFTL